MPSDALLAWHAERLPRLQHIEEDCLRLEAIHVADLNRVQGFIRAYVVLLYADFQGFCRDLHDECAERFVDSVIPVTLRDVLRSQCVYGRKLDTANPNSSALGADFKRYQFDFWAVVCALDPRHKARQERLDRLNVWRNAIAHHDYDPDKLGGTTTLTVLHVSDWRTDCDVLATAFDAVVRNHLQAITGVSPWPP